MNDEMDKVMFSLVHAEAGKGDTHGPPSDTRGNRHSLGGAVR